MIAPNSFRRSLTCRTIDQKTDEPQRQFIRQRFSLNIGEHFGNLLFVGSCDQVLPFGNDMQSSPESSAERLHIRLDRVAS